jgi:hypothetical protein
MNRLCILKATKRILESQSGGTTQEHLDTLKQNAINAGYLEEDIEVKWVTDAEYQAILEANKPIPTAMEIWEKEIAEYDNTMPRPMEDHIELAHNGQVGNPYGQAKYDQKKLKRANKPVK